MSKKRIEFEINWRYVISIISVAIVILVFWRTLPLWHWLFFGLIYRHIVGWTVTVVLLAIAIYFIILASRDSWRTDWRFIWLALLCLPLWVGYLCWSTDVYGRTVAFSFEPEVVQELPDTTNVRYIPYEVAQAFARARQEDPTKMVGDIDPILMDGEFYWVSPRIPNGIANFFFRQTDGILLVAEDGTIEFEPQVFQCGEGMAIGDAIAWRLFSKRYQAEYPEIFYLKIDGTWTAMAPYVTYDFRFPVFVPKWGGVMLVHPDCQIEDLSPNQAQTDPRLVGQRIFPEALARIYSLSWGYRFGGLWNIWWTHQEQVEVANLEGTKNEMPYYLPTTWGPQWMMATEPSGPSQSIFKIFWFDTHSGQAKLKEFTQKHSLIGPNQATGYAKSETPGYNWLEKGKEETSGTYLAIEPRPVIRGGSLYWQYSVTTNTYTGVGLTILVNSFDTEDVLHFCSRAALIRWLAGEGGSDSVPCARAAEPVEVLPPVQPGVPLEEMTTEQLIELLRQIANELERRGR